jgi:hypothetical protein
METSCIVSKPKLIHWVGPNAQYYGMPDDNVYIIYNHPYKKPNGHIGIKFIIARLKEFAFDYKDETLFELCDYKRKQMLNYTVVDRCNQRIEVIKISRTVRTFKQAEASLNKLVANS